MALTTDIGGLPSPIQKILKHVNPSIADGTLTPLISGITGKRIRIWRLHSYCASANKTCELFSGTNPFPLLNTTKSVIHELKSSDGIPVFTCNAGEDFKADPSSSDDWFFYIVYSID